VPTTTTENASSQASAAVLSSLSQYILPCPMGLELAMENAVKSAFGRADFGSNCTRKIVSIKRLFSPLDEYDPMNLRDKLVQQVIRQEEKAKAKAKAQRKSDHSEQGSSRSSSDNGAIGSIIAGTLNDGCNTNIGQYRDDVVVSKPGATELTLMLLQTNAPVQLVSSIRCIGPILALVTKKEKVLHEGSTSSSMMSGDEVSCRIQSFAREEEGSILVGFQRALSLWSRHARLWSKSFGVEATVDSLDDKVLGLAALSFRASCIRNSKKKNDKYKSPDLLGAIGSIVPVDKLKGRPLMSAGDEECHQTTVSMSSTASSSCRDWKVALKGYDFEVVAFIMDSNIAIGVSLLPHQKLKASDYSKGRLPSDIAPPIVGNGGGQLIRLRASTAAILVDIANPQPGDVMIDACAGLGTIPVEAGLDGRGIVAIGGEIVSDLSHITRDYMLQARRLGQTICGSSSMIQWDATLLCVRESCVDIFICDLPFGQKCMSANKLNMFLPLLVSEMARVLRPGGKAVLLGGSFDKTVEAISSAGPDVFKPCHSIFPVNIGGLSAWVIEVERSHGKIKLRMNHREKVRRMTVRRATDAKERHRGTSDQKSGCTVKKKKRLQA